jgi:signal transduction histidine kinase
MMSEISSVDFDRQLAELKLRALAEFAAGAGHEINNPIATIVGYVQQLLPAESDPDRRHALATIGAQAYRVRDMIGDCMLFARPSEPRPESLDLSAVVREVAEKFAHEVQPGSISWQVEAVSEVGIYADPVQLRVVISSLLRNSCEALVSGGTIALESRASQENERPVAILSISDDGPGLSEPDREHLFDPFYSGRQAGRGLGFGLPKAWRIATLHGGRIDVSSPSGKGLVFTIIWPASVESAGPLGAN